MVKSFTDMADINSSNKEEWPLTNQGVIDWKFVFEDEEDGLIPLILMANTPFVLKECTTLIIQQLFSRENDTMNIMKHVLALEQIIPNEKESNLDKDALMSMKNKIAHLLRKIQADRIQYANEFLRRKTQTEKERRLTP